VIGRDGARIAALIPISLYDRLMQPRRAATALLREMASQANMAEDEAMDLALEAVRAVRRGD
jgi:hypothetical protein